MRSSINALRNDLHRLVQRAISEGRFLRNVKQYVRSPYYGRTADGNGYSDRFGGCCLLTAVCGYPAAVGYPVADNYKNACRSLGLTTDDLCCLQSGFEGWPLEEEVVEVSFRAVDLHMLGREMRRTYT